MNRSMEAAALGAAAILVATLAHAVEVDLELIADHFVSPVDVVEPPDGSGRLFIVDQTGVIRIRSGGTLLPEPFLDVSDKLIPLVPVYDERGLLGLAFHPDYANNGRFFIRYSAPPTGTGTHREILAEYSVMDGDPNQADPDSEVILFDLDHPDVNHNGGGVAFGPDGFLYFSMGDGGGEGDELANPNLPHGPDGNGQNIETLLGKVLRIDVDAPPQPPLAYAIPPGNPFVGGPGVDEIYAYGFRNPYRFSFDDGPGGDGRLYVADVGQNRFEELSIVEIGGNYGWARHEGFHCFDAFNPNDPPPTCENTGPGGEPLLDPVLEYDHETTGITIIGGFVYRGRGVPELVGRYVFGDFSEGFAPPTGHLFFTDITGPNAFDLNELTLADGPLGDYVKGVAEDAAGELYVLVSDSLGPSGSSGRVYRIVVDTDGDGFNNLQDNCTEIANADQRDTNGDGFGNVCDPDLDNNLSVNFSDLGIMKGVFFTSEPDADLDGNGSVNFADLATMKAFFFGAPGPSGLAP